MQQKADQIDLEEASKSAGKRFGYARVSSTDQDLTVQLEQLKAAGCSVLRSEKASGTTRAGREQLEILLDFIQAGDVLVVTRLDRLARSVSDLIGISQTLEKKGAGDDDEGSIPFTRSNNLAIARRQPTSHVCIAVSPSLTKN